MTYNEIKKALVDAGIGDNNECRREAMLICERFASIPAGELPFRQNEDIPSPEIETALRRRLRREPLQYILGEWEFYGLNFSLTPDCLIPRPDTELTVEAAIERLPRGACFADIGTGSGAIAVSILHARPDTHCYAVDISRGALDTATANAERLGVGDRFHPILTDIFEGQLGKLMPTRPDALISNPPYIPSGELLSGIIQPELEFEPRAALDGGADGLDFYRYIIPNSPSLLSPDGMLIFEVGIGEAGDVCSLGAACGYSGQILRDLGGIERTVILTKQSDRSRPSQI